MTGIRWSYAINQWKPQFDVGAGVQLSPRDRLGDRLHIGRAHFGGDLLVGLGDLGPVGRVLIDAAARTPDS